MSARGNAKAARRRKRTTGMRITEPRIVRTPDGGWAVTRRKVRGPKRGKVARAAKRAGLMREGAGRMRRQVTA
jgi:hypothetical protein